jgi:hypothetical protein
MLDSEKRGVWLFAKPLSGAQGIPALVSTSDGRFHLCHWGVLVTELSVTDLTVILQSNRAGFGGTKDKDDDLGALYELYRIKGSLYTVRISHPFTTSMLRVFWTNFSPKYIGDTQMQDNKIAEEGMYSYGP